MRQAGIIAGAMLYALDHHVEGLAQDHARATRLAEGLAKLPGIEIAAPETNLVFFRIEREDLSAGAFCERLLSHGIRMAGTPDGRIRACLHYDVNDAGIDLALSAARKIVEEASA